MKKLTIAVLIACCSLPALAQTGGFHGDETPPPQGKEESGYRGSQDARQTSVQQAKEMRNKGWVTLEGNIEKKIGGDRYQFRDKTGTIELKIDDKHWNGQDVSPNNLITISGRVHKDRHGVRVEVSQILKQ